MASAGRWVLGVRKFVGDESFRVAPVPTHTAASKDAATTSSDGHKSDGKSCLSRLLMSGEEEALPVDGQDLIALNKQVERLSLQLERSNTQLQERQRELCAAQDLAAQRALALESLMYISKIPACDICLESMVGSGNIFWMLKTQCKHHVCTRCWRQHNTSRPGEPPRCPWYISTQTLTLTRTLTFYPYPYPYPYPYLLPIFLFSHVRLPRSLSLLCSASFLLSPLAFVLSLLCSALCLTRWVHPRVALLQEHVR